MHELLYPLAQGYDSSRFRPTSNWAHRSEIQPAVGREMQRAYGQESQVVLTTPIIEGLDGVQKMSKSLGNAIGIRNRR